jgi:flagellar biosynthesis chaperone FliJ
MKHFFTLALTALSFGAFAQTNDPASCYNPNSAVYDCTMVGVNDGYEDGYADGLAACEPDTVVVTDTVIVDISAETLAYYLNVIANLEQGTIDLQNTVAQLNDSINGLEGTIATQAQVLSLTQFALDNCFDDNNALDATIDNQQTYIDQLLAELDSQQTVITTLTTSLDECTSDLTACDEMNADIVASYNEVADLYNECAADLGDATADLAVCDVTAEVWQTAAEFYADSLESTLAILDATKLELSDCSDAVAWNADLFWECSDENDELDALVDALVNQLEVNAGECANIINIHLNTIENLEDALATCGADLDDAEYDAEYWNEAYNDAVTNCNNYIAEMDAEISLLEGSVSNLIDQLVACNDDCQVTATNAYQNGYNYGYETGLEEVSAGCQACFEANEYNVQLIYDLQEQLADCNTTGIDILDPSGNVLTQVTGYYNEIGQSIDPRNYSGLVIRRHADGTFSKYVK